jgi:hypothetical protein
MQMNVNVVLIFEIMIENQMINELINCFMFNIKSSSISSHDDIVFAR